MGLGLGKGGGGNGRGGGERSSTRTLHGAAESRGGNGREGAECDRRRGGDPRSAAQLPSPLSRGGRGGSHIRWHR